MTVSEQPNPERSHPVGLSTPSTSWGSRTGTVLKVEHSKTLPPGPPLRAREVFANRFTEAASTGDTRRALQVCRRPLPTGVHTGESTSNPGRAHARHHPSLRPRRALSGGQGVITVKNLVRKKGREGRGARQRERTGRARRRPPRCLGRRRQRKGARGQGRECVVRSAPGPGEAPAPPEGSPRGRAQVWGWRSAGPGRWAPRRCHILHCHGPARAQFVTAAVGNRPRTFPQQGPSAPRGFCRASPTPSGRHRPRRPPASRGPRTYSQP